MHFLYPSAYKLKSSSSTISRQLSSLLFQRKFRTTAENLFQGFTFTDLIMLTKLRSLKNVLIWGPSNVPVFFLVNGTWKGITPWPIVWREPTNHTDNSYFNPVNVTRFNTKTKRHLQSPGFSSVRWPVVQVVHQFLCVVWGIRRFFYQSECH